MARKEKRALAWSGVPTSWLMFIGGLCLFGVAAGSGYLWNKSQIQELGTQIKHHEARLDDIKRKRAELVRAYAMMCSPADLDARVKRMKLDIKPPQLDQIVRLDEPISPAAEEKLVAQRAAATQEEPN